MLCDWCEEEFDHDGDICMVCGSVFCFWGCLEEHQKEMRDFQ